MRTNVSQGVQVLRRVLGFLAVIEVKPRLAIIAKLLAELDGMVTRLSAHAVGQETSNRAFHATAKGVQARARELRREYLRPIARMGESLFEDDPTLRKALVMPEGRGYERLIAAALAMANQASERGDRFVAAGSGRIS